jgi:acyl transferase domain-containing protein/NAD(P)-dependent dehydrogenase (short-subunit alcohol dehydrogenase family)/acyl carrier protein
VAASDGVIRQPVVRVSSKTAKVAPRVETAPPTVALPSRSVDLTAEVEALIVDNLAASLSIARETIEADVPFFDYGVDSILGVGFVQQLNRSLGAALNTTVLFDHTTVQRLAKHIVAAHRETLKIAAEAPTLREVPAVVAEPAATPAVQQSVPINSPPVLLGNADVIQDGVAVIGMSGQFPGARNVDEFWRNMAGGVETIAELPAHYLDPVLRSTHKEPGKCYCTRGGVLATRDCFDPLFFNISPKEAESMNPHQRLILEESWKALEDAGLNPKALAETRTGIFVGCEPSAYVHESFTGASDAIVASRLSYFLNLRGPAFVVNTGCSSSGVALHLACESLRNGECDLALSGGAFAVMGETILVGLAQTEMLSLTGRSRPFDAEADGMVMSEGVGMVALKRLSRALADGDTIYGVIRASGINQDGASNGITAPNGVAQRELIEDVYRRFKIDPERISYVEAHGTGTKLGDPIEANALVQAYRAFTGKRHYCAIGSAKSYIGHTSGNAGVTGLISILLSLTHKWLPGLNGFSRLNPLIDFSESAFYPATEPAAWRAEDGRPRMAALNSFGHSGTNVHLVVEEFEDPRGRVARGLAPAAPELIVVSAKDEEALTQALGDLAAFVRQGDERPSLVDIAFTLQTGRAAWEHRVAFVASRVDELADAAAAASRNGETRVRMWRGVVAPAGKGRRAVPTVSDADMARWLADGVLDALGQAWVQGAEVDWARLRRVAPPARVHLPTYPFARERYWKPASPRTPASSAGVQEARLHPLVHRNVSTLGRQAFRTTFTGSEAVLRDHVVGGEKVLPGVAYLEMARAAVADSLGDRVYGARLRLAQCVWTAPLAIGDRAVDVEIEVDAPEDGRIEYRVLSMGGDGTRRLHHQGVAMPDAAQALPPLDLARIRAEIGGAEVSAQECYAAFEAAGVRHGASLRSLSAIRASRDQALAELVLPADAVSSSYGVHPVLLDGAWQATVALALADGVGRQRRTTLLPFALDVCDVLGPLEARMWAWIKRAERTADATEKLDIDLCTEAGEVRVRMQGLASKAVPAQTVRGRSQVHLTGDEHFLTDHSGLVPAAVLIEMARAATAQRSGSPVSELRHVVWPQPLHVGRGGAEIAIDATPANENGALAFSLATQAAGETRIHCQGQAAGGAGQLPQVPARDVAAVLGRCFTVVDKSACGAILRHTHGPSLMTISELRVGAGEAIALLDLPDMPRAEFEAAVLPPPLVNGAILASVVWLMRTREGDLPMPFSLDRLVLFAPIPPRVYAHVRHADGARDGVATVDIDLLAPDGKCIASMQGLTLVFPQDEGELVFAAPDWVARPLGETAPQKLVGEPVFLLSRENSTLQSALRSRWPLARIEVLSAPSSGVDAATPALLRALDLCRALAKERSDAVQPVVLLVPGAETPLDRGVGGLLRTLRLEHPRMAAKALHCIADDEASTGRLLARLAAELTAGDVEVRYNVLGEREVRTLVEKQLSHAPPEPAFARGDVVWITGGLGGIGQLVARHLALDMGTRVVLSGRSDPDADGQAFIDDLRRDGADALYLVCDCADPGAVAEAITSITAHFGRLDGLVHSAGVNDDAYLANKTDDQAARVLAPKVSGVQVLDQATKDLPLKHVVLFSSIAGALGNPGQADYAGANAFLDGFARARNDAVRRVARHGKTVSINWPLWREGGMRMGAANEALMREATGMTAMGAAEGLRAFDQALANADTQVLVAYGDGARIRERLLADVPQWEARDSFAAAGADAPGEEARDALAQAVTGEVVRIVSEVQRIAPGKISLARDLAAYGFDSITFTELANALNKSYGLTLMPTLFFGIADLQALVDHLLAQHRAAMLKKHAPRPVTLRSAPVAAPVVPARASLPLALSPPPVRKEMPASVATVQEDAIAVIGMAGKFPGAADLGDFWHHLEANHDLISEVPPERWSWQAIYGDPHTEPGKTRIKWGGFVADADCFDAAFFGISAAEAEALDPQLRIFLETVWSAIEDAGYAPGRLSGSRTGVFAGVATGDYKALLTEARRAGTVRSASEPFPFMVANRVSYLFNFRGPSEVIDTACSSSLIAVHRAIESLRQGACDVALAGGVNVLASPAITIASSRAGMLSEDGRCMTFDARANGYVRSEGAAVVMLKPLRTAIAEGDHIHGVIRASGENHGGRSASPTAPNSAAQTELLVDIYRRAGIDPATVQYIEAHGTGTALGDPVEVNGLKGAFAELGKGGTAVAPWCGLGSVKANIGHLEAAAGVAGLIKVLLMLRHSRIPGNPLLKSPNPYLELEGSPFELCRETRAWDAMRDPDGRTLPRRAGVSSFGAGGSNAHVVVEEYRGASHAERHAPRGPALIVLSAKSEDRLREAARRLAAFIRSDGATVALSDIAYTLQVGREAFTHRLAFAATSLDEVEARLSAYAGQGALPQGVYVGRVPDEGDGLAAVAADEDMAAAVSALIAKGKHEKLLAAWVAGLAVDWARVSGACGARRIGLPTYPFARERHWVSVGSEPAPQQAPPSGAAAEDDILLFEESWCEAPLVEGGGALGTVLVCCVGAALREVVSQQVHTADASARVIFVAGPVEISDVLGGADGPAVDAVLDLRPLEEPAAVRDAMGIVTLLKELVNAGVKPRRLLLTGASNDAIERCHLESWIGFERSLGLVMPDTEVAVVFREGRLDSDAGLRDWVATLCRELKAAHLASARYRRGARLAPRVAPVTLAPSSGSVVRQGGVYLVTGGIGGLGMIVAEHLARDYGAKLLLTGRSRADAGTEAKVARLNALGGDALYMQADVADESAVRAAVAAASGRWGRLDGVLHVAGISGAAPVLQVDASAFAEVMKAKVAGSEVLHRVLAGEALDFICHFSSSAAILGDMGSCDYAIANRFQTAFARAAADKQDAGCRTLVVNWPLWREGGRGVGDAEQTRLYLEASGQRGLEAAEGMEQFEGLLAEARPQHLVLAGLPDRLRRMVAFDKSATRASADVPVARPARGAAPESRDLGRILAKDLEAQVCDLLLVRSGAVEPHKNFVDLGFDSISLAEFARLLSRHYGLEILPSVFFSHATLGRLAAHLLAEHGDAMEAFYRAPTVETRETQAAAVSAVSALPRMAPLDEPIAIIGTSGRFPQARNVEELWRVLANGIDAVTEIPPDRFDWRTIYAPNSDGAGGTSNSKWCGCIPGLAEFDPLFFEISPLEAERMDPRQRHLLQEAWRALEDAGYGPAHIESQKIGMFVGVEEGSDYGARAGKVSLTSAHNGILASRLAYFLNFNGPVMAINTACSSALVALHTACQSLRQGDCDAALAAGVNLMVSPAAYVGMTQAGMLSPDGKCHVFDAKANGMVPGEAVAVVALKRLSRALADGDPIQAVIRASGVNYDGRTNGITAPSGAAQADLVRSVARQARISLKDIGFVITHGTGTPLGDSVEINALADAFKDSGAGIGTCALTSTKSNLGHTFAASGLVSLISLVEAMRHGTIPASLHCETESDYIRWAGSPFFVNKSARTWTRRAGAPRIGAVSAFGMSGTNGHVVVEEYVAPRETQDAAPCHVLALSAKTADALEEKRREMLAYLRTAEAGQAGLAAISYTLLAGRHHFAFRSAVVARDIAEAIRLWDGPVTAGRFDGRVDRDFVEEDARSDTLAEILHARGLFDDAGRTRDALAALAASYVEGYAIDWPALFAVPPRRVRLPGYPFARERHWLDEAPQAELGTHGVARSEAAVCLGPVATTEQQGCDVPLALTYPELVRSAAEDQLGRPVRALAEMVWGRAPGEGGRLEVGVHHDGADVAFSIAAETASDVLVHLGQVGEVTSDTNSRPVRIARLRAGMKPLTVQSIGLGEIYASAAQAITTFSLPRGGAARDALFPPSMLDAVCRLAAMHFAAHGGAIAQPLVPHMLQRIEAFGVVPEDVVIHLTLKGADRDRPTYDAALYDAAGAPCLLFTRLTLGPQDALRDISLS